MLDVGLPDGLGEVIHIYFPPVIPFVLDNTLRLLRVTGIIAVGVKAVAVPVGYQHILLGGSILRGPVQDRCQIVGREEPIATVGDDIVAQVLKAGVLGQFKIKHIAGVGIGAGEIFPSLAVFVGTDDTHPLVGEMGAQLPPNLLHSIVHRTARRAIYDNGIVGLVLPCRVR